MLYQLENLNNEEKELVLNAPAYITILIAGADDDISKAEINRSFDLVKTKTFSEPLEIREIYEAIEADFSTRLNGLITSLPNNLEEREAIVTEQLSKLNKAFAKMETRNAKKYYQSLLSFAALIATAAGGIMGFEAISHHEKKFVKLPMISEPGA